MDALIATMSIPGSVNTDVFLTYVQEVLAFGTALWAIAFLPKKKPLP
ncbi:hypothetical protein NIES4073_25680 [Kalymmatonema gypsitolerans NIES-4073]|nr:hypothetical protein NIES4073_25680 [Scytonema sp. NIES-4073]